MESGLDSIHSLCSSLRFLLSSILSAVSSSRRCARQPHPLKEDDRLEDTQAPANGFVLLASIGIKRIASPSPQYVSRNDDDDDVVERGRVSGHGYITRDGNEIYIYDGFFDGI